MRASYLRMLIYDLKFLGPETYDADNLKYEPARIIIDNEAAIAMAKCNKDTAENRLMLEDTICPTRYCHEGTCF